MLPEHKLNVQLLSVVDVITVSWIKRKFTVGTHKGTWCGDKPFGVSIGCILQGQYASWYTSARCETNFTPRNKTFSQKRARHTRENCRCNMSPSDCRPLNISITSVVVDSPENTTSIGNQLVCLLPVGIFNCYVYLKYLFPLFQWRACKLAKLGLVLV